MQGQIVEVEGEVSTLQDQVESLVGRVDSLESDQAATNAAIASLEDQNAILQDQIDANADDVSSIQAEVAALQEENETLQSQVDANRGDTLAAQQQIATNSGLISALQQSLSSLGTDLQDQIDNNAQLIAVMDSRIDALETAMTMKQNVINGYCPHGEAIRAVLSNGSVICDNGQSYLGVAYTSGWAVVHSGSGCVAASCPSGYFAVGVGYYGFYMEPYEAYTNFSAAVTCFRNNSGYDSLGYVYATCLRQQVD